MTEAPTRPKYIIPYLPPLARDLMRDWESKGKVAVQRVVEAVDWAECQNCMDVQYVYVSLMRHGPFRDPPSGARTLATWVDAIPEAGIGEGWYTIRSTQSFPCPHCMPPPEVGRPDGDDEEERIRQMRWDLQND